MGMSGPSFEWGVSRFFPGMPELLLITHTLMDEGVVVNVGARNDKDGWVGKAERAVAEDRWIAVCDDVCRELCAVDIHWFCSAGIACVAHRCVAIRCANRQGRGMSPFAPPGILARRGPDAGG